MSLDLFELKQSIKTKEELSEFIYALDTLRASLYKTKINAFDEAIKESVSDQLGRLIGKTLKKNKIKPTNKKDLEEFLSNLKEELGNVEVLNLTLAYSPTPASIEKICDWVRDNISEDLVLEIDENSQIIGGAEINFRGKYRDYSLISTLSENSNKIGGIVKESLTTK